MKSHIELIGEDLPSNEASFIQGTPIFPMVDYCGPTSNDHQNDDQQEALKPLKEIADYIEAKFKARNCFSNSWEFESSNPSLLKIKSSKHSISTNITLSDAEALQYLLYTTLESCEASEFAVIDTQTAIQCLKYATSYSININQPYKNWFDEKNDHDAITPLSQAVSSKNIELVDYLLDNGAIVTPSVLRAISHSVTLVSTEEEGLIANMLKHNVNINISDDNGGILHGMFFGYHGTNSFVRFLLINGLDPDLVDKAGRSALHNWISKQNNDISITLIEHGADLYLKDKDGVAPIDLVPTHATYFKSRLEQFYNKYQEQLKTNQANNGDGDSTSDILGEGPKAAIESTAISQDSIKPNKATLPNDPGINSQLIFKELQQDADLSSETLDYLIQVFGVKGSPLPIKPKAELSVVEINDLLEFSSRETFDNPYCLKQGTLPSLTLKANPVKVKLYDAMLSHSKSGTEGYSILVNSAEGSSTTGVQTASIALSEAIPGLEILTLAGGKYIFKKGIRMVPFVGTALGAAYIVSSNDYSIGNVTKNLIPLADLALDTYGAYQSLSAKIRGNDQAGAVNSDHNNLQQPVAIWSDSTSVIADNFKVIGAVNNKASNRAITPYLDIDHNANRSQVLSFPVTDYKPYRFVTVPEDLKEFNQLPGFESVDFDFLNKTEAFPIYQQSWQDLILYADTIDDNFATNKHFIKDIRRFNLNTDSLTDRKILKNLDTQVDDFIAKDRKGSIRSEFPGEFLEVQVREVLDKAKSGDRIAKKARKLLIDKEYLK